MKNINKFIPFNIGNEKIIFNIKYVDEMFSSDPKDILNHYYLVIRSFFEYCILMKNLSFIEFLKDSVENNYLLNDYLVECSHFTVKKKLQLLYYEINGDKESCSFLGHFIINNKYHCYALSGAFFVEDIDTKKTYFYFCD